jgi:hypothetical protein
MKALAEALAGDDDAHAHGSGVGPTPPGWQFLDAVDIAMASPAFRAEFDRVSREIRLVEDRRRALIGWARLLAERVSGSSIRPATVEEAGALRGTDWDGALDAAGVTQADVDAVPAEDVAYWRGYNEAMRERDLPVRRFASVEGLVADLNDETVDPMPVVAAFLQPIFADFVGEYGTPTRLLSALATLVYGRHKRVRRTHRQPTARKSRRLTTFARPVTLEAGSTLAEARDAAAVEAYLGETQ